MGSRHLGAAQRSRSGGWAGRLHTASHWLLPALAHPAVSVSVVPTWLPAKPCPMLTKAWSTQGRRNRKGTERRETGVPCPPPGALGTAELSPSWRPPPVPQGRVLQALPSLYPLCRTGGHAHSPTRGHLPSPGLVEHLGQDSTWGLLEQDPVSPTRVHGGLSPPPSVSLM